MLKHKEVKMKKEANNYYGALQSPVDSGFDAASTAMDVINGIDLSGKIAIVTGGYSNIGLETVKALAEAGAEVYVPARNVDKAKKKLLGIPNVTVSEMKLTDPVSIKRFADEFLSLNKPLHILINNAGVMLTPLIRDDRGYELQFSTNHLGHFQLTAQLWPSLKKANGARVVTVSSWAHHTAPIELEDPNFEHQPYDPSVAYTRSKTANILFTVELDKRAQTHGIRAYTLHPGMITTVDPDKGVSIDTLKEHGLLDEEGNPRHDPYNGFKTPQEGASTTVWCATSPKLANVGGVYCEDTEVSVVDNKWENITPETFSMTRGVIPQAVDPDNAQKLWALTEKLTGVRFDIV
ncbi:SDR family NAD(P)-dependent oxidoreductase [Chitinophaga sp.]|uniref:SDR family NAD(P)-dependent oxidoreductase n=1 Tax=Chitinophaga sp. TaxID=1869181 RepID=UPI0031D0E5C7